MKLYQARVSDGIKSYPELFASSQYLRKIVRRFDGILTPHLIPFYLHTLIKVSSIVSGLKSKMPLFNFFPSPSAITNPLATKGLTFHIISTSSSLASLACSCFFAASAGSKYCVSFFTPLAAPRASTRPWNGKRLLFFGRELCVQSPNLSFPGMGVRLMRQWNAQYWILYQKLTLIYQ